MDNTVHVELYHQESTYQLENSLVLYKKYVGPIPYSANKPVIYVFVCTQVDRVCSTMSLRSINHNIY